MVVSRLIMVISFESVSRFESSFLSHTHGVKQLGILGFKRSTGHPYYMNFMMSGSYTEVDFANGGWL